MASKRQRSDDDHEREYGYDLDSDDEERVLSGCWPRFLVVRAESEDMPLSGLSPFLIGKWFQGVSSELTKIKRLRDGSFLVDCPSEKSSSLLLKRDGSEIHDRKVRISAHKTLNSSKGVIRCADLKGVSENEIRQGLQGQGVIGVQKVFVQKMGRKEETSTVFLVFCAPSLPKSVRVGYLNVPVTPFVPSPMRCFRCQAFGHTSSRCKAEERCAKCGFPSHDEECSGPLSCVNCKGNHAAFSKQCPVFINEQHIQNIRSQRGVSFPEARKIVEEKFGAGAKSFAKVTAAGPVFTNNSCGVQDQTSLTLGPLITSLIELINSLIVRLDRFEQKAVHIEGEPRLTFPSGSEVKSSTPSEGGAKPSTSSQGGGKPPASSTNGAMPPPCASPAARGGLSKQKSADGPVARTAASVTLQKAPIPVGKGSVPNSPTNKAGKNGTASNGGVSRLSSGQPSPASKKKEQGLDQAGSSILSENRFQVLGAERMEDDSSDCRPSTPVSQNLKKKEASFAVQARVVKDYCNPYDPQSLAFKEGDIITVLEQRGDGLWKGYVVQEGRMAKTGLFPANHVVLVDGQVLKQQQQNKGPQVPDLLNRGPYFNHNGNLPQNGFAPGSDTTSVSTCSTDDSYPAPPHIANVLGPPVGYGPYAGPPPSPGGHGCHGVSQSPAHNSHGGAPLSPGPNGIIAANSPGYHHPPPSPAFSVGVPASSGYIPSSSALHLAGYKDSPESNFGHSTSAYCCQHIQYLGGKGTATAAILASRGGDQHGGDWTGSVAAGTGTAGGDMRTNSPCGKEPLQQNHSPAHSNRNSAGSSDSGRGVSTGHLEPKVVTVVGQHRLSGQSYESGVSSRQSYHSSSSSSLGSLDRLEESGHTSTINVQQLIQANVPDKEVLHAWLHDLHFEDYYPNFVQAGYDMPTISRMTPEDLTAIGITKPAHRKRLKAEIARLHIHDGIPDFCPHDLIEWLHLLGLGMYHETLANQGYDDIEYVTDITWEDLEEIGIKKLGHQKKIMLAIDRLKRIISASKRLSSVEPRRSSIEMLEPPPPAPPIGRLSGEISALPPHMYEGGLGLGAKPKKSPSGDSISTTGSGGSSSSQGSGEMRAITVPREDALLAGGIPYSRQNSSTSTSSGGYPSDMVAIQVKRQGRSSTSEESVKEVGGQPIIYQSFQGSRGDSSEFPSAHPMSTSDPGIGIQMTPKVKPKPVAKIVAKTKRGSLEYSPDAEMEKHESENNSDGCKSVPVGSVAAVAAMMERTGEVFTGGTMKRGVLIGSGKGQLRVETREHIYDQPQLSPKATSSPPSPKPQVMPKPASPLHVATHHSPAVQPSGSPTGRSKKAPPPPPKRTHSIRNDSAPLLLNKVEPAGGFSVTTTASVGSAASPQPSSSNNSKLKGTSNVSNSPSHSSAIAATVPLKQEPATTAGGEKPQPQTQAFASCVKSLSERFGSKKIQIEGSQESLSSDGDDFPPPPPPIAMDIITPKILNYGIPSKSDPHPHVRDYNAHHGNHPTPAHNKDYGFQSRLKTLQTSEGATVRSEQHALMASSAPMSRISPGRDIPATSTPQDRSKSSENSLVTSNLGDKRSESTTSFESTTSSSSTDSNTLPFANENVGTIKQRAVVVKPSIVQTFDTEDGQRSVDLNSTLFDNSACDNSVSASRTRPSGDFNIEGAGAVKKTSASAHSVCHQRADSTGSLSSAFNKRTLGPAESTRPMTMGIPHGLQSQSVGSAASRLAATAPGHRLADSNRAASSEGSPRPPVPSKKPTLVSANPLPQQQVQPQQQEQQHYQHQQGPMASSHQPIKTTEKNAPPASLADEDPQRQSCDVLSDIDDMLQGLTDELDAMLEETAG